MLYYSHNYAVKKSKISLLKSFLILNYQQIQVNLF